MNVVCVPGLVLLDAVWALVVEVGEVNALHVVQHVALGPEPLVSAQRAHVHVRVLGLDVGGQALARHTCNTRRKLNFRTGRE